MSALVAPLREDDTAGQDIPRPYVIVPPLQGARRYQPGEHFSFGMTLIGDIIQLLPYIMLSLSQLEAEGLDHRLQENAGRRGRFQVEHVEVYHPWHAQRQTIYEEGSPRVNTPVVSAHIEECPQRAEQLNQEQVTLHFITPMRLIEHGHLVQHASLVPLVQRLLARYLALESHYGTADLPLTREEKDAVRQQAERASRTYHLQHGPDPMARAKQLLEPPEALNPHRRSDRQGHVQWTAGPTPTLLVVGELIHVGKGTVKSNGWYRIEPAAAGEE